MSCKPNHAHKRHTPKLRHNKSADQAFVEIRGKRIYLGKWGTEESKEAYIRVLREWEANGYRQPLSKPDLTIAEVCAAYWEHCQAYYRDEEGNPTGAESSIRAAIRPVSQLYGGE